MGIYRLTERVARFAGTRGVVTCKPEGEPGGFAEGTGISVIRIAADEAIKQFCGAGGVTWTGVGVLHFGVDLLLSGTIGASFALRNVELTMKRVAMELRGIKTAARRGLISPMSAMISTTKL
jgi:hypothetical protein